MKYIYSPVLAYLIVCFIGSLFTEGSGKHPIIWSFIVFLIYGVPVLILFVMISISQYISDRKSRN